MSELLPGEDLGVEILADVEGGSVDGLGPELLLVVPELGLLTLSLTPKRSTSWLSPNSFFVIMPPFAIVAAELSSEFLSLWRRKGRGLQ
jgi:hypothetical protein